MGLGIRTQAEVDAEIAALKKIKPLVRRMTMFGEDNHAAIDAQLQVLEEELTMEEIYDELLDEDADDPESAYAQHLLDHARDARDWLDGAYVSEPDDMTWEGGVLAGAWQGLIIVKA